jgi:N-acetylmuramoyl-L-alanine amidase
MKREQAVSIENRRRWLWRQTYSIVLCFSLAVMISSSLALVALARLKGRVEIGGFDIEARSIRIYIDQGHNPTPYHNNGAEGNGLFEQDITYDIGCRLAELLRADGRFEDCLSRPTEETVLGEDVSSSLKARVDGAADFRADFFISLHINAYTEDTANGIEVFVSDGDDVSYAFGSFLLEGMVDATALRDRGMKGSADLYVLRYTEMPAALLEMGFISHAGDAELLSLHPEWFAEGIYDGIDAYFSSVYTVDLSGLLWICGISAAVTVVMVFVMDYRRRRTKSEW